MRLVGYVRVSTDAQVEDGLGLATQERQIRDWCSCHGHSVVDVWRDEGVSGSNGVEDRDGLPGALELLASHAVDGLVVARLDRLARALTVQEGILGRCWGWGAEVFTVDGGRVARDDPDDPMRTAMRQMAGVFAELDARMIAKRLRDGRAQKAADGGYAGGAPAFGLRASGGELVTDPDECRVADALTAMRDDGLTLREIASRANTHGWTTKRGGRWRAETVRRVLDQQTTNRH